HGKPSAADHADVADQGKRSAAEDADQAERTQPGGLALQPGSRAFARIRLEAPAVLTRGDRFILRQYSPAITIGGGRVIDPSPVRSPIRTEAARERFARLDRDVDTATLVFLDERKAAGLTLDALSRRAGI